MLLMSVPGGHVWGCTPGRETTGPGNQELQITVGSVGFVNTWGVPRWCWESGCQLWNLKRVSLSFPILIWEVGGDDLEVPSFHKGFSCCVKLSPESNITKNYSKHIVSFMCVALPEHFLLHLPIQKCVSLYLAYIAQYFSCYVVIE